MQGVENELLNKQAYDLWIKFDALQNELFQFSQDAKNNVARETANGIDAVKQIDAAVYALRNVEFGDVFRDYVNDEKDQAYRIQITVESSN